MPWIEPPPAGLDPDAQDAPGAADSVDEDVAYSADVGEACETAGHDEPAAAIGSAPCSGPSEAQLMRWLAAIAGHDESALAALFDATTARVYRFVLHVVRKPALAEEVMTDTYFQVWRQAPRFDAERGRALGWMLGMARSRAIDALRRESRLQHERLDVDAASEPDNGAHAADDLLDVARGHAELQRALMLLQAQPRQLLALAFFNGLSHEEIAAQTHLPLGTVKSQIRRALLLLRQVMGDGGRQFLAA